VDATQEFAPVSAALDFDAVYTEHVCFVWRVLRGMGVPAAQVEDAVQDVFVVVHRRLAAFDQRYSIRTWMFAIAYRVASEHRRKARRTHDQVSLESRLVEDLGPDPAQAAERSEALRVCLALLDQLDEDKRAVFLLAEVEGLTAPEIAEVMGQRLNTVYTRLRRARLQLNQTFAKWQKRKP
jgi:RNA polymerase sigma-70 factor (ECF subfamily)